jgi:serine/arginine repetitive matrix protein 2
MAHTDQLPTVSPQQSGKEGHGPVEEISGRGGEGSSGGTRVDDRAAANVSLEASDVSEMSTSAAAADTRPASNPARPSLVQLGSSAGQGTLATSPHPKRFSAVNINKKFLEKNSTTSGSSPASTSSTATKTGGPTCENIITIKLT